MWTGIEKVVVYGVNFVQGVILARLLCPEDFGLTAMGIYVVLAFAAPWCAAWYDKPLLTSILRAKVRGLLEELYAS